MIYYWVKLKSGRKGCIEAPSEAQMKAVVADLSAGAEPLEFAKLPYPASLQLNHIPREHPCPPFCYTPEQMQVLMDAGFKVEVPSHA